MDEVKVKRCFTCKTEKPLSEFASDKSPKRKDGKSPYCLCCSRERDRLRYQDPIMKQRKIENKKRYYRRHKDSILKRNRTWAHANKDKVNALCLARIRAKQATPCGNIELRLLRKIRCSVKRLAEKGIPTQWTSVLGYSFEDLQHHLESLFSAGMTWDRLLAGEIEIDHVIPRCSFYYETVQDPDFKACWSISNLAPIWKLDNRAKGDRMPDGSNGRLIGRRKKEAYEMQLVAKAAGASELLSILV